MTKIMPSKSIKVKVGDIFAVPLEEELIAAGIVLHISKYWRGGILVGFFNRRFRAVDQVAVSDLAVEFAFTPNYTGKKILTAGDWPIVGSRPDLVEPNVIPKLVSVTHVFYKDEVIEHLASLEEARQYEVLSGWGKGFCENKLRRYFAEGAALID
jgi:hypothetical protein